jgi:hypothetical protein
VQAAGVQIRLDHGLGKIAGATHLQNVFQCEGTEIGLQSGQGEAREVHDVELLEL